MDGSVMWSALSRENPPSPDCLHGNEMGLLPSPAPWLWHRKCPTLGCTPVISFPSLPSTTACKHTLLKKTMLPRVHHTLLVITQYWFIVYWGTVVSHWLWKRKVRSVEKEDWLQQFICLLSCSIHYKTDRCLVSSCNRTHIFYLAADFVGGGLLLTFFSPIHFCSRRKSLQVLTTCGDSLDVIHYHHFFFHSSLMGTLIGAASRVIKQVPF